MTAQFSDTVFYQGRGFSLAGAKGSGLFDPEAHGLRPEASCSACWRGYICTYEVADDQLRLKQLNVFLSNLDKLAVRHGKGLPLFGVAPTMPEKSWTALYEEVNHPIPFTGGLLLADGFIEELYVHMGFHPAWKFREVHELIFDAGRLTKAADRSAEMAKLREGMDTENLSPQGPWDRTKVMEWIQKSFTLDYNW